MQELTYDGERIDAELQFSNGVLVATSHRLLVVTPAGDGPNLRVVYRPNVERVGRGHGGRRYVRPTVAASGAGVLAFLAGSTLSVESPTVPDGAGGLLGPLGTVFGLVGLVDELLLAGGAVCLLVGVGSAAVWLAARGSVVTVERAGRDPVRVSAPGVTDRQLRAFAREADVAYDDGVL